MGTPLRRIRSSAPTRVCDNGGWTDTWFAEYGSIFNIAVEPVCEVQVDVYPREGAQPPVLLHAENYGGPYEVDPSSTDWREHPLLEAAVHHVGIPEGLRVEVGLYSQAPSGASTGTSAAATVALIGALDALQPTRRDAYAVARSAWRVETELLGQQCGIQDQLASAFGGISFIQMSRYPEATVEAVPLTDSMRWELDRRLVLIFLGSHSSSEIHRSVIARLEKEGSASEVLDRMRTTAPRSRDAALAGDWPALGRVMSDNTETQRALHPELVSAEADQIWSIAREFGALGWKVNGAGGNGGSITLLAGPDAREKRAMVREVEARIARARSIPIRLSASGLRVWEA